MVNDETQDATDSMMFGETAGASDLAWMAEELGAGPPAGGGGTEDGTAVNDSTLSASFLETMADLRRRGDATVNQNQQQQQQHRRDDANNGGESDVSSIRHEDQSNSLSRTFDEEDLVAHQEQQQAQQTSQLPEEKLSPSLPSLSQEQQQSLSSQNNDDDDRSTTLDLSSSFQLPRRRPRAGSDGPERAPRKMGPNEKIYVENYQSSVQNRIQQFRRQFPNQLPVYAELSDADKLREQQRVLNLLQRLHIAGDNKENHLSQLNEQEIIGAAHASAAAANREDGDDAGGMLLLRAATTTTWTIRSALLPTTKTLWRCFPRHRHRA